MAIAISGGARIDGPRGSLSSTPAAIAQVFAAATHCLRSNGRPSPAPMSGARNQGNGFRAPCLPFVDLRSREDCKPLHKTRGTRSEVTKWHLGLFLLDRSIIL